MTTRIARGAADLAKPAQRPLPAAGNGIADAILERANVVKSLVVAPLSVAEEDPGGDPYNHAGPRAFPKP